MNKIFLKIVLIIGIVPFAAALFNGLYAAVTGYSGLAIMGPLQYGLAAFADWIVLYSYMFWPTYIVGLLLIVFAVVKLKNIQ